MKADIRMLLIEKIAWLQLWLLPKDHPHGKLFALYIGAYFERVEKETSND